MKDTPDNHNARCLKHTSRSDDDVSTDVCILKDENKKSGYSQAVTYSFDDIKATLEVDYTSLDDSALVRLDRFSETEKITKTSWENNIPLSKGNGKKSVLILGNSFIQTSNIRQILTKMMDAGNRGIYVDASSRGYATVPKYLDWNIEINRVRAGEYGILFMCGIYSQEDAAALPELIKACKVSNTVLVLFPAHNENKEVVEKAAEMYSNDLYLLNWQGEIDMLINSKIVGRWDMCYDDAHDHSTTLAGFVGAHMIYRAMFGEIPPEISGDMSTKKAQSYLKNYVTTGALSNIYESQINRF